MSSARTLLPRLGRQIRVLVVDDSVVFRRVLMESLQGEPDIEVVGSASNGAIALQRIAQFSPDLVTLDIEMPEMDGLTTLREIRQRFKGVRVVMCSTLTERGAAVSLEALAAGADDYLTKPTSTQDGSGMTVLRSQIADKIRQFFPAAPAEATPVATQRTAMTRLHPRCVAVGVSTGGPNALAEVIPALPIGFPLPVFIVQHMPPMFTRLLAERLRSMSRLPVFEASDGMEVVPGQVYLAPGDYHMQVQRYGERFAIALDQGAPENFCRPAVDVLFRSIGKAYGGAAIAVILTGMGQDGLRGSTELHQQGACVIAQDEASSVVWGMPGYVVRAGLADVVCPLGEVAGSVLARTR